MSENNQILRCYDCGIPYSELGLDLVLPDQQWKKISPTKDEGGILCPNCICKRAKKYGGTCVQAWIDMMDYSIE
jgi:hypothetical protein